MRKTVLIILVILLFLSCSSDKKTNPDTEQPTVIITYPPNNSLFTSGTTINIVAEAEDNEEVNNVKFYIDGLNIYEDISEPYMYNWDTIDITGSHTIYAKAVDTSDNNTISDVINVTITDVVGSAPNPPSNPSPSNNSTSISIYTNLSWSCSDPDNDPLTYDVYFGESLNPPLINPGQSETTFYPGPLNNETTYYWKIIANDNHSNFSIGNVWQFTTIGGTGTVTDIDGNIYQTLVIGDQEWMVENLKVTHYRNGDAISNITDNTQWANLLTEAYCFYDNDIINGETYGAIYNWYAVDDSRGLAPTGWHVPSDVEIMELEMYLGMSQSQANNVYMRGTNEGSKLAGNYDLWDNGDLRTDPEFNNSGFCLLPGGNRSSMGPFYNLGWAGYLRSADSRMRCVSSDNTGVYRLGTNDRNGFSVRCTRN